MKTSFVSEYEFVKFAKQVAEELAQLFQQYYLDTPDRRSYIAERAAELIANKMELLRCDHCGGFGAAVKCGNCGANLPFAEVLTKAVQKRRE